MAPRSATTSSGPAPGTSAPTLEPRPHRLCHAPGTSSGANARREHTLHFTTCLRGCHIPSLVYRRVPSDRAAFRPTSLEGSHRRNANETGAGGGQVTWQVEVFTRDRACYRYKAGYTHKSLERLLARQVVTPGTFAKRITACLLLTSFFSRLTACEEANQLTGDSCSQPCVASKIVLGCRA